MNDRFKFRVWDKENFNYLEFEGFKKGEIEFNFDIDTNSIWIEFDHNKYILEQCTGLKDKNDKLIFEGDILELYISTKKAYRYQVKYEIGSFMLVSNDEIFDFRNKWNDNVYPLSQLYFEYENEEDCIWECEVIGNIYENEDLLQKECE